AFPLRARGWEEADAGACDEIADGRRCEHVTAARLRCNAGSRVHGDPTYGAARDLALAGVNACANVEPERLQRVADRARRADRPARTVKRREEPVACRVDLVAAKPHEHAPDRGMVLVEQLSPAPVAELRCAAGRVDDVREEQRRQHAVRVGNRADAGEELLDLVEQLVDAADPRDVIVAGKLDETCTGDLACNPSALLDVSVAVAGSVED